MEKLDPLVHAPARLQLLATLSAVSEAEFATLRDALEVSDSVLSKHVSALAGAGYVRSRKGARAGRRTTWVALTDDGRRALQGAPERVLPLRDVAAAAAACPGPSARKRHCRGRSDAETAHSPERRC